jgi:hypothetical protein
MIYMTCAFQAVTRQTPRELEPLTHERLDRRKKAKDEKRRFDPIGLRVRNVIRVESGGSRRDQKIWGCANSATCSWM